MSPAVDSGSGESPLPFRKLAHATAFEIFRNSLETTQAFQIGWESLFNRRRNVMSSQGNGSEVTRLTWERCGEEDVAMWWKVMLMVSVLCDIADVGYAMCIRGSVLNRDGKKLVQCGRECIKKGKELQAEGLRLWEKGQGLRMEGIYLTREIENSLDYEWRIMDEVENMIFEAESLIEDGVKMMEEGHSLELAGEGALEQGRALMDKGERMIGEGGRLIDHSEGIRM